MLVQFQVTQASALTVSPSPAITIDAQALGDKERQTLEQLVKAARFFDLPARLPAPRGAAVDACSITIEDRGRRHTINVSGPVSGPALQRLIDELRTLGVGRGKRKRRPSTQPA